MLYTKNMQLITSDALFAEEQADYKLAVKLFIA